MDSGKHPWVPRGRLHYSLAGEPHAVEVLATNDDQRFKATGDADDGSIFTARWRREEMHVDGTIAGMPGYRVELDGAKAARGICPNCGKPFYGGKSNKTQHGPKDPGNCHQITQNKKRNARYHKQKAQKQALAMGATGRS